MKMAKASEQDMLMALDLANALDALAGRWGSVMPEKIARPTDEEGHEAFDIDDHEDCRRVIEHLIDLARSASLFRVAFGMTVLLDPRNKIMNPDTDTLEHHPETVAALAAMAVCAG